MSKTSNAERTTYILNRLFYDNPDKYFRINPILSHSSRNMHDASNFNIQNLLRDAQEYIDQHKEELDLMAKKLYDCK